MEDAAEAVEAIRNVLPQQDPFALSDHKFVKLFRVSKNLCREIVEMVTPYVTVSTRLSSLTVLATLRFYASGSYQEITGSNSFVAISQASTSRSIKEITNALNRPDILRTIRYQLLKILRHYVLGKFYVKYRFPGPIGCIDCTHISIVTPQQNEHLYINRKGYHSLNVQLICDTNLKILNCNARFPGLTHDAHIWRQSPISTLMENMYRENPDNLFFLLGDSGYPTRPWLLTPLGNPQNADDERYNNHFCSIRSTIERCNGVLKNRFRCLLRHRTLHYDPVMAGKIINACCVLHNLCIDNNIPEADEPHEVQEPDYGIYAAHNYVDNIRAVNPDLVAARETQRNIIIK
ncbi:putative nuclease HARBI1 [Sitophilus oryzae]|uniref:Nuclease HARBI1 n=1 Tax=Sitophilus oryzae TaxID=7048 RepID=A0A6J2Y411_SITOR|nr:putative nuclease HARBI1 [Sitophilus oryzae]